MQAITLALAAGVAVANHHHMDHHHAEDGMAGMKHMVPDLFKEHKIKFAPETTFGRVSRQLSHWMGFDKGLGFMSVTAFTDDMCMHPIWETGANVGRCMMAVDPTTGTVGGSFRNKVVERKGKFEMKTDMYSNIGCWGSPMDSNHMESASTRCHGVNRALDGAGTAGSYQYRWTAHNEVFKIVHFKDQFYRGRIELEDMDQCSNYGYDGFFNITRYWIQKTPPMQSCYQVPPDTTHSYTRSYMTHCASDEESDGPGAPANVWFNDDHCGMMAPEPYVTMFNYCNAVGMPWYEQIYGGARLYNSPAFGRMHGNYYRDLCFRGGNEDGMNPADKLTPWNRYKDIDIPRSGSGSGSGSGGDGSGGDNSPNSYPCWTVSNHTMNYEEGLSYCSNNQSSLAAIYNAEELASARSAISFAGAEKAITSARSYGVGWAWYGSGYAEPWYEGQFPLNTGQVEDQRSGMSNGMYSLHRSEDNFVWDADGVTEEHRVLCRLASCDTE